MGNGIETVTTVAPQRFATKSMAFRHAWYAWFALQAQAHPWQA